MNKINTKKCKYAGYLLILIHLIRSATFIDAEVYTLPILTMQKEKRRGNRYLKNINF